MDSKPFIRSSNIWGRMVFSFLGPKDVLFYEIIGGGIQYPPRQLMYIFDPAGNRVNQIKTLEIFMYHESSFFS